MAKLKVLKIKDKRYIFPTFKNNEEKIPAVCVFKSFPPIGKTYMKDNSLEINITDFQYKEFADECIERFENFEYEDKRIETITDFLSYLPEQAIFQILVDCYSYAQRVDEFTMGE